MRERREEALATKGKSDCLISFSILTEVDDVDFAANRLAVLSHRLAVRALMDLERERTKRGMREREREREEKEGQVRRMLDG